MLVESPTCSKPVTIGLQYSKLIAVHGRTLVKKSIKRVNRGAAALDKVKPDWVYDIVPEKLSLRDSEMCVCGQIFGDYGDRTIGTSDRGGVMLGFALADRDMHDSAWRDKGNWELLDALWSPLIAERHRRKVPVFLQELDG